MRWDDRPGADEMDDVERVDAVMRAIEAVPVDAARSRTPELHRMHDAFKRAYEPHRLRLMRVAALHLTSCASTHPNCISKRPLAVSDPWEHLLDCFEFHPRCCGEALRALRLLRKSLADGRTREVLPPHEIAARAQMTALHEAARPKPAPSTGQRRLEVMPDGRVRVKKSPEPGAVAGASGSAPDLLQSLPTYSPDLVTLDQVAAICNRSKQTLARWVRKGKLPRPHVRGGGGKAHQWRWSALREPLSLHVNMKLPNRFPGTISS